MALAAAERRGHITARSSRRMSVYFQFGGQEPTRVVDRGHLDSTGGQGGLRLEPIPFKRRDRSKEMVLAPSVLLGREENCLLEGQTSTRQKDTNRFFSLNIYSGGQIF